MIAFIWLFHEDFNYTLTARMLDDPQAHDKTQDHQLCCWIINLKPQRQVKSSRSLEDIDQEDIDLAIGVSD